MDTDAILYGRYSDRPAAESSRSLDTQDERAREYAAFHGLTIIDPVIGDERVSARKVPLAKRPGGAELLARVGRKKIRNVIVYKLDRLFRNIVDGVTILERWQREGVSLHVVNEGGCSLNTTTSQGFMSIGIRLLFAQVEAMQTAERLKDSMRCHQERGYVVGGVVRYGWQATGEVERVPLGGGRFKERKLTAPVPSEQAVIARLLHWDSQGISLGEMQRRLEVENIPSRGVVRNKVMCAGWDKSTLRRIIRDAKQREERARLLG